MSDTTPTPKVGDVVNGHRLTQAADGTYTWEPLPVEAAAAPATKKSRKALWITLGVVGGIIVIGSVANAANGGGDDAESTAVADAKPAAISPEEPKEEEPANVVIPDVSGLTADTARANLEALGLDVVLSNEPDATVTGTDPATGSEVAAGSTVTIIAQDKPKLTLEQQNALEEAQQYLDFSGFSRQGLIDQMSSQYGAAYPIDVATWAVDALGADWNAEAAEQAQQYLDFGSFSRDSLYEQLTSQYGGQFTPDEAAYALAAVGY